MTRRLSLALILGLALIATPTFAVPPDSVRAQAQPGNCEFILGFQTIHDLIPEIVGDCVTNEFHNPENGDGLQITTNGLLVWRKADNWTAFTNGATTWVNGPFGLQARANTERFPWEAVSAAAPGTAPAAPAPGGVTGGAAGGAPVTPPAPTPTPAATPVPDQAPSLDLSVPDDVDQGETFNIRLIAEDDTGIDAMWWWATDTTDSSLRNTHTFDCGGATPCRQTWQVSTDDTGTLVIHARARDLNGNFSEEVTEEIRVRRPRTPTATPTPTS